MKNDVFTSSPPHLLTCSTLELVPLTSSLHQSTGKKVQAKRREKVPQMKDVALEFGKHEVGFVTLLHLPPSIFLCQSCFCPVIFAARFTLCIKFCLCWLETVLSQHTSNQWGKMSFWWVIEFSAAGLKKLLRRRSEKRISLNFRCFSSPCSQSSFSAK